MRTTLFLTALLAFACSSSSVLAEPNEPASAELLEQYVWLERDAISDPEVANKKIHELIVAGIQHESAEIVHCTISAMALHIGAGRRIPECTDVGA